MDKPLRKSRVRWFSDRQKRKRNGRRSPRQLVSLRLHDLAKLFRHRYGVELPDDDAGRDDLAVAINHIVCLLYPRRHAANWIDLWAPWLSAAEQRRIVDLAIADTQYWTADELAWRLRVTKEERRMLGLTTIGAIDETTGDRAARRLEKQRERQAKYRHDNGAKPRAKSVSRIKPWVSEGISRATWYRRKRGIETTSACETSSSTA